MMLTLNAFAKDVIIEWFLGKFAAANAIIEALCSHLALVEGGSSECKTSYFPIDVVALELRLVVEKKSGRSVCEKNGSQELQPTSKTIDLYSNHEDCEARRALIKMTKGFTTGEYSQPFLKPPHLEQPISTLLLFESTMAFGRTLVSDADGNYKGPLMLSPRKGMYLKNLFHCTCFSQSHETALGYSKLVNQNLDADAAFTVRHNPGRMELVLKCANLQTNESASHFPEFDSSTIAPLTKAMTLGQPGIPNSYASPNGAMSGYKATMGKIPKWAVVKLAAPLHPWVLIPRRSPNGKGIVDFLP
ncbi:hypothetical protein RHSIM_Rhsim11G0153100 [Rhododendron simsii]|uniref:Uncharacterized protein n=1 Tax=Rhododendron simsii TaxID=118357 RepID=A0A834GAD7_RHOSS|nr:hypothetical protein RHSIM_Rhsim11G0153100 [Rhododendron simsii]